LKLQNILMHASSMLSHSTRCPLHRYITACAAYRIMPFTLSTFKHIQTHAFYAMTLP